MATNVTRVTQASAQASSVAISTPHVGDLIVVFAYANTVTNIPSLPAGYTSITTLNPTGNAMRIGCKLSDGTETTSGTWTNATQISVIVFRGAELGTGGSFNTGNASSATLSYNALTGVTAFKIQDGSSWAAGFGGAKAATAGMNGNITGMTNETSAVKVNALDTEGGVTTFAVATLGVTGSGQWITVTIEILSAKSPAVGSLALSGVAPSVVQGTILTPSTGSLTITGGTPTVTPVTVTLLTPGVGSLALSGAASSVVQGTIIAPAAGLLAFSGFGAIPGLKPTIDLGLFPSSGSLVLTGTTPSIKTGISITPNSGALSLTGSPPKGDWYSADWSFVDQPTASFADTTNQSFYTSPSQWVPPAGSLVFMLVGNTKVGTPDQPSSIVANGLVWDLLATQTYDSTGTPTKRISLYVALSTGGFLDFVRVNFGTAQTGCFVALATAVGPDIADTTDPTTLVRNIVANASNTAGTTASALLAAFLTTNNAVLLAVGINNTDTLVADAIVPGYTIGTEQSFSGPVNAGAMEWRTASDTAPQMTWATSNRWAAIGIEIIKPALGVLFDASSTSGNGGSSPITVPHTVTPGLLNTALVATIKFLGGVTASVSSVKYAGVDLALVPAATLTDSGAGGGGPYRVETWVLANPASGLNDLVVIYAGASSAVIVDVASYSNVNQTLIYENAGAVTGVNLGPDGPQSISLLSFSAGSMIVAAMATKGATATPATTQNTREVTSVLTGTASMDDAGAVLTPDTTMLTWTILNLDQWVFTAIALLAANETDVTPSIGALVLTGTTLGLVLGTVLTPPTGALTLTGLAPTVQVSQSGTSITPAVGSLSLSGNSPALAFAITPNVGALTISGIAPNLIFGTVLTPAVGALALSGAAPSLVSGTIITPAVGALALTGTTPVYALSLQPATGSLTLTGASPALSVAISPSVGALTLSGNAPSVSTGMLYTPAVGALTLSGNAPARVVGTVLTPAVGALAFTGLASSLLLDTRSIPSVGALTLTGNVPTLGGNSQIVPIVGALVVSGLAPLVVADRVLSPSTGALVLSGLASRLDLTIQPVAGTLSIPGNAPTTITGVFIAPASGALSLLGKSLALNLGTTPSAGTLILTGIGPVVSADVALKPSADGLALTGYAPSLSGPVTCTPGTDDLALDGSVPSLVQSVTRVVRRTRVKFFSTARISLIINSVVRERSEFNSTMHVSTNCNSIVRERVALRSHRVLSQPLE